ncbi:PepSY-associated TM helix domain-containing protein [Methylosinus sp. sav-2]|uniref:PepSY-associated TM helix domain-containing protein n=1 Tax=Methylosinus sp. sav-2 TaxID=2485168 RepID=UPI00047DB307|nr:PepSY-associated TM helix domain-containing protein [Methylosinus sp. sav-2]
MAEQAKALNFTIERPIALYHLREKGVFNYRVRSSLDIGEKYGATGIDIDVYTGELLNVSLPTGGHSGVTVSTWLAELHSANVFGPAYQVVVSLFGVTVAALSASGVYIWWKKRGARGALHAPKTNRRRSAMSDVTPS